jgi:predicted CoA-binding protein
VKPVNPNEETIEGLPVYRTIADVPGPVDIVSLYVPAAVGIELLDAIAAKQPGEVWINPSAESAALEARATDP